MYSTFIEAVSEDMLRSSSSFKRLTNGSPAPSEVPGGDSGHMKNMKQVSNNEKLFPSQDLLLSACKL